MVHDAFTVYIPLYRKTAHSTKMTMFFPNFFKNFLAQRFHSNICGNMLQNRANFLYMDYGWLHIQPCRQRSAYCKIRIREKARRSAQTMDPIASAMHQNRCVPLAIIISSSAGFFHFLSCGARQKCRRHSLIKSNLVIENQGSLSYRIHGMLRACISGPK